MSELQVLVSTMHKKDYELCSKMNINSDAIIINQSDTVGFTKLKHNGFDIGFYSFNDRGVGRSRNEALMRSSAEIICLADDDMVYTNTYREDVLREFRLHPEADVIIFNVERMNASERQGATRITEFQKIGRTEYRNYGAVHIACRREKLVYKNISFHTMFGPGAESGYGCGEDTIFLKELIDKKFRIYKSPINIAKVDMSESTWFNGYNEKYFHDKGALIGATYPKISYILVLFQAFRNSKRKLGSYRYFRKVLEWYVDGLKNYKSKTK